MHFLHVRSWVRPISWLQSPLDLDRFSFAYKAHNRPRESESAAGTEGKSSDIFGLLSACSLFVSAHSNPPFIGIHPLDDKYYASDVIKCKDGSKSFTRDRLNDDFCDCVDGTDEPGTSACRNVGSTPQFIFSSRVNDYFCDCRDGSDEDGGVNCPNTCVMGGNSEYNTSKHVSKACDLNRSEPIEPKYGVRKEGT